MSDSCGTVGSVLVIDNDPVTQAVVEAYFRASGASDVITASDGRSAMDIVNEKGGEIGVVLCDLNTPDAEDFNFLRHLTDSSYKGQIAILNGDRAAPAEKRERAAGSPALNLVHSIRKPLDLRDLEVLTSASGSDSGQADSDERTYIVSPQDLQLGLNCRHVVPYYHPKVCAVSGKVIGAEALARWNHPGFGVISPAHFIPMAEQNDLYGLLTETMLTAAVYDAAHWREEGIEVALSINVTSEALDDIAFPDVLTKIVEAAGAETSDITLEFGESRIQTWSADAAAAVGRLRGKGFGVSIDDFGTGYSDIQQLRGYPFTELKIDQSLIRKSATDLFARASVENSVYLGKQLGLELVAEGVETGEEYEFVRGLGIDMVQGYYIAKPMPAAEFESWLRGQETLKRRTA